MDKLYLTEYLLSLDKKLIERGKINLIDADTGCGKTTFIFGQDGLIFNTSAFTDTRYVFLINLNRVLYVCDTQTLKDEIINDNKHIVDILELKRNKSYKEAAEFDFERLIKNNGKVKVCTYALLGILMGDEYQKKQIINNFDLIIFDEAHKLIEYSQKYDTLTNTIYTNVIKNFKEIAKNSLFICLTATPYLLDRQINRMDDYVKEIYSYVLFASDHEKLRRYEVGNVSYCNNIMNYIKDLCIGYDKYRYEIKEKKILIYTKTIKKQKKIKEMLCKAGYKAEYLCSKDKLETTEQKNLRKYLIEKKEYPSELEILIINDAYDTGWNLKSSDVLIVLADSTNLTTIKQVRGRIRAHINWLVSVSREKEDDIISFTLPERFINVKLTSKIKHELIEIYGTIHQNNKCNWQTFKEDLVENGYGVKTTKNGSYIFSLNEDSEQKNASEMIAESNIQEEIDVKILCEYIESIIGIKLFTDEDKKTLIKLSESYTSKGEIPKTKSTVNRKLEQLKLPYIIESNKSNGRRYWIIRKK